MIHGGIIEIAGKSSKFLLENEEVLIEAFLSGVKSSNLTYLWSDFGSKPIDGIQANGWIVERSVDRMLNSDVNTENFSFENCIDWYWVYSIGGEVVYEEYSHTTCGESCNSNGQDACLDDGIGGGGGGDSNSDPEDIISYIENRYNINLTNCEKEWIYEFGYLAYPVWINSEKAMQETTFTFGANNAFDCTDAFRHAYWSAINYRDVGALAAISFGAAHECNTPNGIDRTMDFYNNNVGFSIGQNFQSGTDSEIKSAILNAMNNGEMQIYNPNQNGLISSENCF